MNAGTSRRPVLASPLILVAAVALVAAAAFAGCTTVPTNGPVKFESMGTSHPGETSLPVLTTGPDPGDTYPLDDNEAELRWIPPPPTERLDIPPPPPVPPPCPDNEPPPF